MIKTLNPCPNPAKTAEIMSRYRPIAPKPEPPASNSTSDGGSSNSLSPKIKQSPYLRSLWPQLQARPTRTRKRGRALPSFKRQKPHLLGFCPPAKHHHHHLALHSFAPPPPLPQLPLAMLNPSSKSTPDLVTLSLLPCSPELDSTKREEVADFNTCTSHSIPEEKDLLKQLQGSSSHVIVPQPVRPIGSCIIVGCINELDPTLAHSSAARAPKRPDQVEEEVECEQLPAVISDSNNRVRMANSAYREMVGQPECSWLQSIHGMPTRGTRIGGDVALHLCGSTVPVSSNGFSCWARIDWNNAKGGKKCSVNAFCDVIRLSCESRDYLFTWRFHTRTREASHSSCNA